MPATLPDDASCLNCGYMLRGLTDAHCPECGRTFDAENTRTFALDRDWRWLRRLGAPPRGPHTGLTLVAALGLLILRTDPGEAYFVCVVGLALYRFAAAIIAVYAVRLVARLILSNGAPNRSIMLPIRRDDWRWLALPLVCAVVGSAYVRNWPLELRFAMSRTAFENAATAIMEEKSLVVGDRIPYGVWVGLYHVEEIAIVHSGGTFPTVYFETGGFFRGLWGFTRTPDGAGYRPPTIFVFDAGLPPPWFVYGDIRP